VQTRPVIYRGQSVNFKCSYGVACLESPKGADLVEEAHRALLHAKNIGGTRVATSQQSINAGARPVSFAGK
jgi:GGDEF domain-containing protein